MKKFALLLLVAPLALAACGGASSTGPAKVDPVSYVRHAARSTAAEMSASVTPYSRTIVSRLSPPARLARITDTGTRVPLITGLPCCTFGSIEMRSFTYPL